MKDSQLPATTAIRGAKVILEDQIVETDVVIADGLIQEVNSGTATDHTIDGRGLFLAPALVDIHGDAFERQMMPRPNVFFPMDAALLETDRQLAANGIATAYHALTLSWEPGLRSVERGRAFIEGLTRLASRLTVENRIQLRWETFAFEAVALIEETLRTAPFTPSVAFNDHTSMTMRGFDVRIQDRLFEQNPDYDVAGFDDPRLLERVAGNARRAGLDAPGYLELMRTVWSRRPQVDGTIRQVAETARQVGAPMLSHDDTQIEARDYYRALGGTISEFPMVLPVAEAARKAGDALIFGAPNAVRGGSHIGSLGAGDMVEAGLCDILASDYYYPAMLAAVARLDSEKRAPPPETVVAGVYRTCPGQRPQRSRLYRPGQRADLVLVDWPEGETPAVVQTLVAGRTAYLAQTSR